MKLTLINRIVGETDFRLVREVPGKGFLILQFESKGYKLKLTHELKTSTPETVLTMVIEEKGKPFEVCTLTYETRNLNFHLDQIVCYLQGFAE